MQKSTTVLVVPFSWLRTFTNEVFSVLPLARVRVEGMSSPVYEFCNSHDRFRELLFHFFLLFIDPLELGT